MKIFDTRHGVCVCGESAKIFQQNLHKINRYSRKFRPSKIYCYTVWTE